MQKINFEKFPQLRFCGFNIVLIRFVHVTIEFHCKKTVADSTNLEPA